MVTLREVAARAGVSIKTVSRIVNGDPAVAKATRDGVEALLATLNYVPNQAARVMRGGVSSVYGLMTDAVATTPYSVDIVRGAQEALREQHKTLIIADTGGDLGQEAGYWRMFRAHRVAGVIYAAMYHRAHAAGHPAFGEPIVLANCFAAAGDRPSIIPDDEGGGYRQAAYLLKRGHRRIALVTLVPDLEATRLRGAGVRRAFREAGVAFDARLERRGMVGPVGAERMVAYEAARDLLGAKDRPTAVICGNDQVALQVYAAAGALGLTVPGDVSVMGFDDLAVISANLYPALTTVALPHFDIGRIAVETLHGARARMDWAPRILVDCPLVERNSCRALV